MYDDTEQGSKHKRVEEIIEFIETATEGEKGKWKGDLLLFTFVCESLAFNKSHEERVWLESKFSKYWDIMRETAFYQRLRQRGFDEGPSLEELKLQSQRQLFMIFVQQLFPELVPLAKQQINLIKDPDVLQSLSFKMFSGCTAEEARQYLLAVEEDLAEN